MQAIYLHGFASGPNSSKAVFFARKLAECGIETSIPDLNSPSFEEMTLTTQLSVIERILEEQPVHAPRVLIGSSMGGLLATMISERVKNLRLLILLAPGFSLNKRWPVLFGEQTLDTWRMTGKLAVHHYAFNKSLPLNYSFFEDINTHVTENLSVQIPTVVFHGRNDEIVPISESEKFAKHNSRHAVLYSLDDDHQLINSLDSIWQISAQHLQACTAQME